MPRRLRITSSLTLIEITGSGLFGGGVRRGPQVSEIACRAQSPYHEIQSQEGVTRKVRALGQTHGHLIRV